MEEDAQKMMDQINGHLDESENKEDKKEQVLFHLLLFFNIIVIILF